MKKKKKLKLIVLILYRTEPTPDLGENVPNFGGKKSKKLQKGGTVENKSLLLDLSGLVRIQEIYQKLVKNNYKGLFENGKGEI